MRRALPLLFIFPLLVAVPLQPQTRDISYLFPWERGIGFAAPKNDRMRVYLWFYEWNMFDARRPGQHTPGTYKLPRRLVTGGRSAELGPPELRLRITAREDGADLRLTVANRSEHDWPDLAGIIPCFNPGPEDIRNRQLANTNTYFVGHHGLEKLILRQIHFADKLRALVDREATEGRHVFSEKWPTAEPNAMEGLIVRESTDGKWVAGIAWDDFLSSQGHNPWECMHLCVRVGPLKMGEEKTIRGRVYLFQGNKQDVWERYQSEFKAR